MFEDLDLPTFTGVPNRRSVIPAVLSFAADTYLTEPNPGGAKALRTYLDENTRQPLTIIFGAMRDKDIEPIAELLFPKADLLVLTRPKNSRAMDPDPTSG